MIQSTAYGVRLNMLALMHLLLLMMGLLGLLLLLLLLLLTVAYYWLLLMLLLLLLGMEQLRITTLSVTLRLWWWRRWMGRDLWQVVMILHIGIWQDSTAGETVRYVRKQPMMFHRGGDFGANRGLPVVCALCQFIDCGWLAEVPRLGLVRHTLVVIRFERSLLGRRFG